MSYSVTVRDSIMIAHSFKGEFFGPAQALHGATLMIDTKYIASGLDEHDVVVDIGLAFQILKEEIIQRYNYKNLDDFEEFKGRNTTVEFLAKAFFDKLAVRLKDKFKGSLKVTVHESHLAWASFKGQL